jgi:signal transduction histidine kinase
MSRGPLDPSLAPDEDTRRKLLNILLLGLGGATMAVIILASISEYVFREAELLDDPASTFALATILLCGMGIITWLNNRVSSMAASLIFVLTLMIIIPMADAPQHVAGGRSLIGISIPIVVASILLHPIASFIVAGINSGLITVLSIQLDYGTPNAFAIIVFFTLALAPWLSARVLKNSLAQLRQELIERRCMEDKLRESRDAMRELYQRLETAVEEERARITRELHDDIVQKLAFIVFNLDPEKVGAENARTIKREIREANDLLRATIRNLRMPDLESQPLAEAIQLLLLSLGDDRLELESNLVEYGTALPYTLKANVYHIIKEAVVNAIKHSDASAITVTLQVVGHELLASVIDNGNGVANTDTPAPNGFGLRSMRERADALGIDLQFESSDTGTKISLVVPLA